MNCNKIISSIVYFVILPIIISFPLHWLTSMLTPDISIKDYSNYFICLISVFITLGFFMQLNKKANQELEMNMRADGCSEEFIAKYLNDRR